MTPGPRVKYVAAAALSHDGLVRDHNEDSVVVGPWTICAAVTRTPQTLLFPADGRLMAAVADGLGGHAAGELASSVVVQELARQGHTLEDEASVLEAISLCNRSVYAEMTRDAGRSGMGTTVAGVVIGPESVVVFNVGDSRVYSVDDQGLRLLSVDDNPPLGPGETRTSILTQTLGGSSRHQRVDPHVSTHARNETARYLLCTDGLSDVVEDDTIASLLHEHRGDTAAYELWRAAIEAGGPDNITLVVIEPVEA